MEISPMSHPQQIIPILLGIVLWIFAFPPIFFLFLLPMHLLRRATHLCATIFRPDLIHINGSMDSFLSLGPLRPQAKNGVSQIWILNGKLDIVEIRNHVYKVFLSTPELRRQYRNLLCYFELWGLYVFKKALPPEEFILEEYITEYQGPPFSCQEELEGFMGNWANQKKYGGEGEYKKRACIEILVIYLQEKDESVLLCKSDHGLNDGFTSVNTISVPTGTKLPQPTQRETMGLGGLIRIILSTPYHLAQRTSSLLLMPHIPLPNYTGLHNGYDNDWSMGFGALDFESIRKVRKATGARVISILAAIQNGAVRRHCIENGKEDSILPKCTAIMIPSPVAAHPAMMEGAMGDRMGNHFTSHVAEVPLRDDLPLQRVIEADKDIAYGEYIGLPLIMRYLTITAVWGFPAKLILLIMAWNPITKFSFGNPCCQCVSPMVLSSTPHTLLGLEVKHLYMGAQVPISTPSMNIGMIPVSHSGKMDLVINTNFKIFQDQKAIDRFTKVYLKDELQKLVDAVEQPK